MSQIVWLFTGWTVRGSMDLPGNHIQRATTAREDTYLLERRRIRYIPQAVLVHLVQHGHLITELVNCISAVLPWKNQNFRIILIKRWFLKKISFRRKTIILKLMKQMILYSPLFYVRIEIAMFTAIPTARLPMNMKKSRQSQTRRTAHYYMLTLWSAIICPTIPAFAGT